MMEQEISTLSYLRTEARFRNLYGSVMTRRRRPWINMTRQTRAALDLADYLPSLRAAETEYIYCIKLPNFECIPSQGAPVRESTAVQSLRRQIGRQRYQPYSYHSALRSRSARQLVPQPVQHQWIPREVVKFGKSDDPARRFREILGAFQNLGVEVPLLQHISSTDDPQTTLQKSKTIDSVVFIMKVQDIGTAEGDIRKLFGISLGEDFIDKFLNHLDEEQKKPFKDDAGMTEWVLMDAGLATHLQWKFRYTQLCRSHLDVCMGTCGFITPHGTDVHWQLRALGLNYYIQRGLSTKLLPEFTISFQPTNFNYRLKTHT